MSNIGKSGNLPNKTGMSGLPQTQQISSQLQQQQQQQQQQQEFLMRLRNSRLTTQQEAKAKTLYIIRIVLFVIVILIFAYIAGTIHEALFVTILLGPLLGLGLYFVPRRAFTWLSSTRGYKEFYKTALLRADTRSEPVLEKSSQSGENHLLSYGFSAMQGWRRSMEDDHTLELLDEGGFFGIYDGHSGSGVANFCGVNMYDIIKNQSSFVEGNIKQALYDGFIAIDRKLHSVQEAERERSGCTAVVLYVREEELFCANAGDSRCVLCRNGKAYPLSVDHKPYLPHEQSRIERAGGYVLYRRVNGVLALSRAIGDFNFKNNPAIPWDQQAVTSAPDVRSIRLNRDKDEFAIVACDGIWDVLSNEEVVDFVRLRVQMHMPLQQIAEALIDKCLSPQPFGLGCDNMSVVIVQFKRLPQRSGNAAVLNSPQNSQMFSLPTPTTEKLNKPADMIGVANTKVESNPNMAYYDTPHAIVESHHNTYNSNTISGNGDITAHVANENNNEQADATNLRATNITETKNNNNNNNTEIYNNDELHNPTVSHTRSSEPAQANDNDITSSIAKNHIKNVISNDGEEMKSDAKHPLANNENIVYSRTVQMNNLNNKNNSNNSNSAITSNDEGIKNSEISNNNNNNNNSSSNNGSDHRDSEHQQTAQTVSNEKNITPSINEDRLVSPRAVPNGSQFSGNVTNNANISNNPGGTTTATPTTTQRNLPRQGHTSIVSSPETLTSPAPPFSHLAPAPTSSSTTSTLPIRSSLPSTLSSSKNELAEMNEHAHKQSAKQHKNDGNLYSLPQGITRSANRTGANHSRSTHSRHKPSRAESPRSELDMLRSAVHNGLGKS